MTATHFVKLALTAAIVAHHLALGAAFAVEMKEVRLGAKQATVFRVEAKEETLELFLRDDSGVPLKSFEGINRWLAGSGRKLVWAMNAGMYHGDLSPVGLHVTDGKAVAPLNLSRGEGNFFLLPNGVFVVSGSGSSVMEASEYPRSGLANVRIASQSGPLLVQRNRIHQALKPSSTSVLTRNGVGIAPDGAALFVITKDLFNLYEFAQLFRDVLKCEDALYFDGTVSSLFEPRMQRSDKLIDLGPVIGITAPLSKLPGDSPAPVGPKAD